MGRIDAVCFGPRPAYLASLRVGPLAPPNGRQCRFRASGAAAEGRAAVPTRWPEPPLVAMSGHSSVLQAREFSCDNPLDAEFHNLMFD